MIDSLWLKLFFLVFYDIGYHKAFSFPVGTPEKKKDGWDILRKRKFENESHMHGFTIYFGVTGYQKYVSIS